MADRMVVERLMAERIEHARTLCRRALDTPPVKEAAEWLDRAGLTGAERTELLRDAGRRNRVGERLTALRSRALAEGFPAGALAFERALLVRTALESLDRVACLPVDESVKHLFCREFAFYSDPPETDLDRFSIEGRIFPTMCGMVTLSRFPGGQHHWVVSGFPRSWFLKISPLHLPGLSYFLFTKMGGLSPYFVPHVNHTTFSGLLFTEREYYKSFYRMTAAIEKQPAIRGIMSASWLHSHETHRISPHLAFFNRPYVEAGGLYIERGPASPRDGFLTGDPERTRLYQSGKYKPAFALMFCTRAQALSWKAAHADIQAKLVVR